ncbi:hypothetical protein [Dethiobacter alkaliphilus]|nr:hypothetical protein [Dethiobacter alkaliphilus]
MLSKKLSKRSFRSTAAGVWVSKEKEATNVNGQLLGLLFDFGLGSIGGIGTTYLLSKTGRDHVIPKGVLAGITVGSTITALLSVFPNNKVKPKDAASNLAYMFSHALYGITTTALVAKMGHASLFDPKPLNNYLQPTEYTSEEIRDTAALRQSQERESAMYH